MIFEEKERIRADAKKPGEDEFAFYDSKQYRAIATRYDKTARNFLAAIHLAAAIIWLN